MLATAVRSRPAALAALALTTSVVVQLAERAAIARWQRNPDRRAGAPATEPRVVHRLTVSDGARLQVLDWGAGSPILLVHGITANAQDWRWVVPHLTTAGHRVLALDLRGHGGSTHGTDRPSRRRLADDLREVLEQLDLRDGVLAGHSLGAYLTLAAAVTHPDVVDERIRGLVLVAGTPTMRQLNELVTLVDNASPLTPTLEKHPRHGRVLVRWTVFGARPSLPAIDEIRLRWAECPLRTRVAYAASLAGDTLVHQLDRVGVPVLAVCGTHDRVTPPRRSKAIAADVPRGRLELIDGAGHVVPAERPAEVARAIVHAAGVRA